MTENDSYGNTGKKQKGQCVHSLSHVSSASFLKNNSRHGDEDDADRLVQNAILGKNVGKAVFRSDLMKLKQEKRSIRTRSLSKEETDFHLLMAPPFNDLPRKKSDQLASLLGVIVKRCIDKNFQKKFQIKNIHRITGYKNKLHQRNHFNYKYTIKSKGHQFQLICLHSIE